MQPYLDLISAMPYQVPALVALTLLRGSVCHLRHTTYNMSQKGGLNWVELHVI